ncbi:hypothetical protein L1887_13817 [Cichorium endivia]|nr:hypothetical protein L1887_13817 [Cichorium endivia]
MLPGPPSRNNGRSANLRSTGLLAYAAGSGVAIVDSRSMQLVSVLPIHPPSASTANSSTIGSLLLYLFETSTRRCFFKYDACPEIFSCIKRDPFDSAISALQVIGKSKSKDLARVGICWFTGQRLILLEPIYFENRLRYDMLLSDNVLPGTYKNLTRKKLDVKDWQKGRQEDCSRVLKAEK